MSTHPITVSPMDAITVSPIRAREDGGWTWTVTTLDLDDNGQWAPVSTTYRTDAEGTGLWRWQPSGAQEVDRDGRPIRSFYEWHQELGYLQFNLNCSPGTRRERVLARCMASPSKGDLMYGTTARERYAAAPRVP